MASGIISLGTKSNLRGQIVWSSVSNGSSANTSTVTAELQARKTSNTTIATEGNWTGSLNIGGTTKNISSTIRAVGSSAWKTLLTFSVTVAHAADGTGSCYLYGKIKGPTGTTLAGYSVSGSETVTLDSIPRFATITSAPNFNDTENPVIKYSNPAGTDISTLQAFISLDGSSAITAYKTLDKSGSSYTFKLTSTEREALQRATTGKNSRTVYFCVRSSIDSAYEISTLARTFTIQNPNPTINPTIVDSNSAIVETYTGDSSKLVRYFSNAEITFGAAAAVGATLTSTKVTCGDASLSKDGTISKVTTNKFVFTVTDDRGNTTTKTVTPSIVNYIIPTCALANNIPDAEGVMTVEASGAYFNGSFGILNNDLVVQYRYRLLGGSYNDWVDMNVTLSGNSYAATASLTGLDYQGIYVFQARILDKLVLVSSTEKTVKATPVFDWGESDFQFNVPVTFNGGIKDRSIKTYSNLSQLGLSGGVATNAVFSAMPTWSMAVIINSKTNGNYLTDRPTDYCNVVLFKSDADYGSGIATKVNSSAKETYVFDWYNGGSSNGWTKVAKASEIADHRLKTFYSITQFGMSGQPTTDEVLAAMPVMSCLICDNRRGNDYNISDAPTGYCSIVLFKNQYTYGSGIATKVNSSLKETFMYDWYSGGSVNAWTPVGDVVMRKLWENGKPTSSYPATTETPNGYGDYEAALVCARLSTSTANELPPVLIRKGGNAANIYGVSSGRFARRAVSFTDSGIVFEEAGKIASYSGTYAGDDALIIPTIIYGVKGVN